MEAGYTGLPTEHKRAKEDLMREHERAYPKVRQHALAGTNRDFDVPLTNGEREHQRHLRQQEGLTEHDVRDIRDELRATPTRNTPARETPNLTGPTKAVTGAVGAIDAAATGKGSLFLQLAGVFVGLSLFYLLVKGKGTKALQGLTTAVTGAVHTFIAPIDPIAKLESTLGATPIGASSSTTEPGSTSAAAGGGTGPAGGSVGGVGPSTWSLHLAPKPSKIKVKASTPAQVRAFEKATGAHFAHGAG